MCLSFGSHFSPPYRLSNAVSSPVVFFPNHFFVVFSSKWFNPLTPPPFPQTIAPHVQARLSQACTSPARLPPPTRLLDEAEKPNALFR